MLASRPTYGISKRRWSQLGIRRMPFSDKKDLGSSQQSCSHERRDEECRKQSRLRDRRAGCFVPHSVVSFAERKQGSGEKSSDSHWQKGDSR